MLQTIGLALSLMSSGALATFLSLHLRLFNGVCQNSGSK
jgi:hypothetical protein